jgi:2-polyprenyl-3-methyl-5-hydroxy-6-metoxy-1,4-benzoquinol methylase
MAIDARLKKNDLGFWEIISKPTLPELQKYYAQKYYQDGFGGALEYSAEELKQIQLKLKEYWFIVNKYILPATSENIPTLLDVGCGEGHILSFLKSKGWSVKGFDFSDAGVRSKNIDCIENLVVGDIYSLLEKECSEGKKYQVVWLQNVLEHVLNPIELLQNLRKLVAENGLAVVTVPNDYSVTQIGALSHGHIDSAFWVAPPDHLNYFDIDSLISTSAATGWKCVDALANFPIDWLLFHPGSNYVRDKTAGKPAHLARIQIENLLHDKPIEDVVKFWSALAKLGMGRNLTIFLRPN